MQHDLMARAAPQAPAPTSVAANQRQAIQRVIETVRQNLSAPISLADMAAIAHFSPCYFNQLFHAVTGMPPSRFVTALRIGAAKRLLLDTDLRIIDVCYEVGYNSMGTFSSRFAQLVGVSPQGFRDLACPDYRPYLEAFLRGARRPFPPLYRSHKQVVTGAIQRPAAGPRPPHDPSDTPILIGLYRQRLPLHAPAAYTVVFDSPVYLLPAAPEGCSYVFAVSFRCTDDPRSYLLLDHQRDDLLVGAGDRPLLVRNRRPRNRSDLRLRPFEPTDPPLLTALFSLMLQAYQTRS